MASKFKNEAIRAQLDRKFATVVEAFTQHPDVTHNRGKGFGSGAIKVKGKIFAMVSSKGQFVVKLPNQRVHELVVSGQGEHFDPGHGRVMKEWLAVTATNAPWLELANEAYRFVKSKP